MEHQTNTPDTLTNKAETVESGRYEALSSTLIEAANKVEDAEDRLKLAGDFLNRVRFDAYGGAIKGSQGDYNAESFDKVLFTFAEEINIPEENREEKFKNLYRIIPRHEGLREGFMKLMSNESTAQPILDAIAELKRTNDKAEREQRLKFQPSNAGHQALEAAGVTPPAEIDNYDHLFSESYDEGGSVEDAAVRIPETDEERADRERRKADEDDAANKRYKRPEMN